MIIMNKEKLINTTIDILLSNMDYKTNSDSLYFFSILIINFFDESDFIELFKKLINNLPEQYRFRYKNFIIRNMIFDHKKLIVQTKLENGLFCLYFNTKKCEFEMGYGVLSLLNEKTIDVKNYKKYFIELFKRA